jgi:hypothetical protein
MVNLGVASTPLQQLQQLNRVAAAAESIADADIVGSRIGREQQWSLAPLAGVLACAKPGCAPLSFSSTPRRMRQPNSSPKPPHLESSSGHWHLWQEFSRALSQGALRSLSLALHAVCDSPTHHRNLLTPRAAVVIGTSGRSARVRQTRVRGYASPLLPFRVCNNTTNHRTFRCLVSSCASNTGRWHRWPGRSPRTSAFFSERSMPYATTQPTGSGRWRRWIRRLIALESLPFSPFYPFSPVYPFYLFFPF